METVRDLLDADRCSVFVINHRTRSLNAHFEEKMVRSALTKSSDLDAACIAYPPIVPANPSALSSSTLRIASLGGSNEQLQKSLNDRRLQVEGGNANKTNIETNK
eukprot:gene12567-3684_t